MEEHIVKNVVLDLERVIIMVRKATLQGIAATSKRGKHRRETRSDPMPEFTAWRNEILKHGLQLL